MGRDPRYDILFEPVEIGPKVLRNRFFQVPHAEAGGSEFPGYVSHYRGMRAEGGWAAVCTGYCSIDPESDDFPAVNSRLWDDGDVENLAAMCDRAHQFGALAGVELWHGGGATAPSHATRVRAHSVSQAPSDWNVGSYARDSDKRDIQRLQQLHVDAALRACEAGFDIIYVYAAHAELPMQFLSPFYNRRTDEYGGSIENRARFWLETLTKVREAVGDTCAIATRLTIDSLQGEAGVQVGTDGVRFVEMADDLVDLWDIVITGGDGLEWGQNAGPSRFFEENHERPYTAQVKAGNHTDKPVVGVGRFTNPDTMVEVIRSGQYDLIGAARPSISDPFLPRKIEEGRLDEIRECIGCNQCISRVEHTGHLQCTQNATAGEEYRRGWHPERFTRAANAEKTVLVVGAGPAGLECARVLGRRGMSAVHLLDAASEIGGCVNWISRLGHSDGKPNLFRGTARGLGEWQRVVNYRDIQLQKLSNVEVHTRSRLDRQAILDYGADLVVIATGCRFATDGFNPVTHAPVPGADASLSWQLTPDEVVRGPKQVGDRVLVVESDEYFMGVSIAQKLAGEGREVTLVTYHATVAEAMGRTLELPMMMRELRRLGVEIRTSTLVERIDGGAVTLQDAWDPRQRSVVEVDSVVLCTARLSNSELYFGLRADEAALEAAGIEGVFAIGDASAPRMIADAIFDGHRLAREIDSPDPAVPLPFIRERRLWTRSAPEAYDGVLATSGRAITADA
jgi:dimethylamine/trimethylamine dehydrogenase